MSTRRLEAIPARVADRSIANYCCYLHRKGTGAHGSGFIVEFEDLVSEDRKLLLALHWEKRDKAGEIETNYVLITSHDTIPGSLEEGWTISCQGIKNGGEQPLSNLVCGVISCCGPQSLLGPGHSKAKVLVAHPNTNCQIQLNITMVFLNNNFVKLLSSSAKDSSPRSTSTITPPVVAIRKCLDQNVCNTEREKIILEARSEKEQQYSFEPVQVYHCNESGNFPKTTAVSVIEHQKPHVPQDRDIVTQEITTYEKSLKLFYHGTESGSYARSALAGKCGSPLVYHSQDTKESTVIGVHVGESDQQGEYFAVTLCGILQLFQENPKKPMKCSYLCDILHYFVEQRFGTQLVKLSVDLPDVENEAALDLLCSLVKHFESVNHADLHKVITASYDEFSGKGIDSDVTQLCESLLHLLAGAVKEPRLKKYTPAGAVSLETREMLVEKCCRFYSRLLNIEYAGITVQVLHTSENLELLKSVRQRFKSSAAVQESIPDIFLKCYHVLESWHQEVCKQNSQEKQELEEEQRKLSKRFDDLRAQLAEEEAQHKNCKRKLQNAELQLEEKKRRLSMME